jgi:hypothetical protein
MDLPGDLEWLFYPDTNLLTLSSRLAVAGQERAITEARREHHIR